MLCCNRKPVGTSLGMAILASISLSGCGGTDGVTRGSVEGTVRVDGTPVEQGTISFVPAEGTKGPAAYGVITNGKYALTASDRGPVVGRHKVQIEAFCHLGKKNPEGEPIKEQVVPERFNSQTTLVMEVTKGQNKRDFDLQTK